MCTIICTVVATDMYYCRDHVDCVCLCRLVFYGGGSSILYRANVNGTGKREIVSGLGNSLWALSIDHNNHVCWGQQGKDQRTVLSLAHIKLLGS